MTRGVPAIASLFLFPKSRRQRAFQQTPVRRPPMAKGTPTILVVAIEIACRLLTPPQIHNLCRVKQLDRKIKQKGGEKERQKEGGVELWWEEAGRRRRKSAAPFSAETVSGAAPQQQREKSMMNN